MDSTERAFLIGILAGGLAGLGCAAAIWLPGELTLTRLLMGGLANVAISGAVAFFASRHARLR